VHMTELYPQVQVALKSAHGGYIHVTHTGQLVRKVGAISRSATFRVAQVPGTERFCFLSLQNRCYITAEEDGGVVCIKKFRDLWDQWVVSRAVVKKKT